MPLGTRLNPLKTPRNRRIYRLIIAELKMQEGPVLAAPPIAPIERISTDQVERTGNHPLPVLGKDQQHLVRHPLAQHREKRAGQIGLPPFPGTGVLIEGPEYIPMRLGDRRAGQVHDFDTILRGGAFPADRLPLAGR